MNSNDQGSSERPVSRQRGVGEAEAEHAFWCRYWEVFRPKGVPSGKEVWYERACLRFIRELKPRRLKQAQPEDVTQFLGLRRSSPNRRLGRSTKQMRPCGLCSRRWCAVPGPNNGRSVCQS
jgi:hypothetical protein